MKGFLSFTNQEAFAGSGPSGLFIVKQTRQVAASLPFHWSSLLLLDQSGILCRILALSFSLSGHTTPSGGSWVGAYHTLRGGLTQSDPVRSPMPDSPGSEGHLLALGSADPKQNC